MVVVKSPENWVLGPLTKWPLLGLKKGDPNHVSDTWDDPPSTKVGLFHLKGQSWVINRHYQNKQSPERLFLNSSPNLGISLSLPTSHEIKSCRGLGLLALCVRYTQVKKMFSLSSCWIPSRKGDEEGYEPHALWLDRQPLGSFGGRGMQEGSPWPTDSSPFEKWKLGDDSFNLGQTVGFWKGILILTFWFFCSSKQNCIQGGPWLVINRCFLK